MIFTRRPLVAAAGNSAPANAYSLLHSPAGNRDSLPLSLFLLPAGRTNSFHRPPAQWPVLRLSANAYSLLHSLRDIEPHYPHHYYFYFPLAEQVVFQADTGSWPANLLEKQLVLHYLAGNRNLFFDSPYHSKGFGFKIFGIGHSSNIRITSGRENHKEAVFFCIFGRTSRLFILGFAEKSDTAVENLVSMF